jgi:AsnC-like protein
MPFEMGAEAGKAQQVPLRPGKGRSLSDKNGFARMSPADTVTGMSSMTVPVEFTDPINARILAVSEDRVQGFQRDPLGEIARLSGVELPVVIERLQAMLRAGNIRRIRQTLLATNLAQGALVAWQVPEAKLNAAFDWMFQRDPFSGHVVTRSTDAATPGSTYKLWTTVKVPQGFSLRKHCEFLAGKTGAERFVLLPAKRLFALGVGHVRRRGMEPGSKADAPAEVTEVTTTTLNDLEWRILVALKREFEVEEIVPDIWEARARDAGVPLEAFCELAEGFNRRKIIGRFSTFLEHVKPHSDGDRVTRFNALFHWAVPPGREIEAGREVGRHHIMTHAYWREGGPEFRNVNVMGVAHGTDKQLVLAHKAAIDEHLKQCGIEVSYTNVFWGGRSEIKPSEISPFAYRDWCNDMELDPESMRE